jgi:predicted TPR repeat methyltransferase
MNITNLKTNITLKINGLKIYLNKLFIQLCKFLTEKFFSSARWFIVARDKMRDLKTTNMELGLFHLQNGNLNDAIFRFKFVDKFLTSGDSKAEYMLGWCYFIKQDFARAENYFASTHELEATEIMKFLKAKDLDSIPVNILNKYYELWADRIDEENSHNKNELVNKFTELLLPLIEGLSKGRKILELGCKTGFIGEKIAPVMQEGMILEGVELSERMCRIARNRNYVSDGYYSKVHCKSIDEYIKKVDEKFDLVIAFNSLSIYKDLPSVLKPLKKKMPGAKIVLCLKLATIDNVNFDRSKINFVYDSSTIEAEIKAAGLKAESIENFSSNTKEKYSLIICS